MSSLSHLEELDFYDNQITKIENLILPILRYLDLSFNNIRILENLDNLQSLQQLYLINNKISVINSLEKLSSLNLLELGANRIRVFIY